MSQLDSWKQVCAVVAICAAVTFVLSAGSSAQTFHVMHAFNGTDGANPYVGLVQGTDGNLYGTTIDGGVNSGGNVFKLTPGGKVTSLYDFCSQPNCLDGQYPVTVLIQGADGNFYGTDDIGNGTVYKVDPAGTLSFVNRFDRADGTISLGFGAEIQNGGPIIRNRRPDRAAVVLMSLPVFHASLIHGR